MPREVTRDITRGLFDRRRILVELFIERWWDVLAERRPHLLPELTRRYAKRMSEITGLPFKKVLKSTPVKNYWRYYNKYAQL